jgi:uncharacterized protein
MRSLQALLFLFTTLFALGCFQSYGQVLGQADKPNMLNGRERASMIAGLPVWIAGNQIQGSGSLQHRSIYLVIEPANFTKENCQAVFVELATEYDQPPDLSIFAYSDREMLKRQVMFMSLLGAVEFSDTAEGKEARRKFLAQYAPPPTGYFSAYYNRSSKGEEVFWYTPSSEKTGSIKVILRSMESETYTGNPKVDLGIAASKGDIIKIRGLLEQRIDANAEDKRGDTALITAIRAGQSKAVEALLAARANVNKPTINGSTPLIEAAYTGRLEITRSLLDQGADINARNRSGISALAAAVSHGHVDIAKILLAKGADPNARTEDGRTVLIKAAESNQRDLIQLLLLKGANINAIANDGETALMAVGSDPMTLRMLISAGADINAKDQRGWTALMYAVDYSQADKVQILLEKGAEVDIRSHEGETALQIAKRYQGNKEILRLLRKAGATE